MTLKGALVGSVLLHLGLMAVHPPQGLVPSPNSLHSIEVTYLAVEGKAPTGRRPVILPAPGSRAVAAPALAKEPKPVPSSLPPVLDSPKPSPPSLPETLPARPVGQTGAGGPAHPSLSSLHLPEGEFAEVEHKRLIRDHLKRHLRHPAIPIQGTVRLRVILGPSGTLKEAVVSEASDPRLAAACLEGARSAEPYPRFPKQIKPSQVTYDFLVQYRPD